jgi:hypothetical protein
MVTLTCHPSRLGINARIYLKNNQISRVQVAHVCNPSYSLRS